MNELACFISVGIFALICVFWCFIFTWQTQRFQRDTIKRLEEKQENMKYEIFKLNYRKDK
jgi:uncharacterized membrane protein YedE/YeeE